VARLIYKTYNSQCILIVGASLLVSFEETPWNGWQKFRKIPEAWKSGLFEYEFKVPSPLACVSICLINHCKEINYCIEDGICEIGWGNTTGTLSNYAGAVYYVLE